MLRRRLRLSILSFVLLVPLAAWAQSNPAAAPAPAAAPPPAPAQSAPDAPLLKPEELDGLVAPIALYPDALLSQVLMASTYPLEVIEADRWVTQNKSLKGDALKDAVDKQAWDDSVKSLTATPSVLSTMSTRLDWTKKLGDAVLAQQPDVMDAIQRMRARAYDNKKLTTTPQQNVKVSQEQNRRLIAIEPAIPDTVYVPYYEPSVVYGAWPYADYPAYPYYWPYTGYIAAGVIATGIAFGAGYALGRWASGGGYWNRNINWNSGNINIGNGNNWQHNPQHRQGVRYNNANVAQKFGNNALRPGQNGRMDFRGRNGQQVLNPGGDRGNLGDRGNAGDRGNLGDRGNAGNRGNVADRANIGDRGGNRGDRGGDRGGNRANAGDRSRGGGRGGDSAFGGGGGRAAAAQSARGRASFASSGISRGGGGAGGGGFSRGGGGGGFRGGGGGGGRGGGGGGRRSDIRLKHDIVLLGTLGDGVGFYRFAYVGSDKPYVGVMAQEIDTVRPDAVTRGRDGYLRVVYGRLGLTFESYARWQSAGARLPKLRMSETTPGVARAALH